MPTATIKTRQVPLFGYVRKNPIDYFELHNRKIPDYHVRKLRGILINHSQNHKNLEIFGIVFHKIPYFLYFEENLST